MQATLREQRQQLVQQTVQQALAEEVTALLGRGPYTRRTTAPPRRTGVRCSRCGQDWAGRFSRAGSYPRTLLTLDGAVALRVPRLSCVCTGTVPLEFATFGRYQRSWSDLEARARQLSGWCLSLGAVREVLATQSGAWLAKRTLNGWVHEAGALAAALVGAPLDRVPPVVLLDGLYLKLMEETGERYRDRQGRDRPRRKRVKVVLLVVYGVDPATGARWVLDWERAAAEDEASWQGLLERLHARGLRADTGLTLFVHDGGSGLDAALNLVDFGPGVGRQRCVFDVLQTVRQQVRGEAGASRAAKRARQRAVLQEAAAIWEPRDKATIRQRSRAFGERWRATEPAAVAALERAFEQTLADLDAREQGRAWGQDWSVHYLRTTSALERVNRHLRQ